MSEERWRIGGPSHEHSRSRFSLQFGFDDISDLGRASERRDRWMEEHLEPGAQVIWS
ncbi:hypothetical protein M8A51_01880 [Schlegelella sp. S2-27]|uniref:Uncharacterized protein n=1 Tax=Caldimonas mangrovi TaxID=2944811 RepID=A0ABT0YK31_9BURK|nr:hypothetical protein [Caldimonas mangrovi]